MYNMVNTDIICPNCGEGHMIREEPEVIKSNTETYTYLCPECGFVHTARSDEDMKEWIKNLDKPIKEEILKEQVRDFMEIVKETTDYHAKQDYGKPSCLSYLDESSGTWQPLGNMETINILTEDLTTGEESSQNDIVMRLTDTFSGTLTIQDPLTLSQVSRIFGIWPAISLFFVRWRTYISARVQKWLRG